MELTRRGFLGSTATLAAAQPSHPNILFLMTDQHRFDCLGANGNPLIRTPNLDRLAARSANFSRAFVQAPVCVPSRVSFFTGRYPHSHRNRVNYTPCDAREAFLQRLLKDAGYQTGAVGKLHLYPPTAEHARTTGYDRALLDDGVRFTDQYSDYVRWRNANDPQAKAFHYNDTAPAKNPFRAAIDYQFTPTAWTGAKTRETLRQFASSNRPFFLYSSFFKPHAPYTVPPPYDSMYDSVDIPLPKTASMEEVRKLPLPLQKQILRNGAQFEQMSGDRLQWIYRSYYASVSMVDHEIGLILDELDRLGKTSNTIVIFGTDHGDQLMEHGLVDKNVFFESSVRVPFLCSLPGVINPGRYNELIEMVDLVPTLLDLAALAVPDNVQGRSFVPLVASGRGAYKPRDAAFAENIVPEVITGGRLNIEYKPGEGVGGILHPDAKMVRTQRWKLNYYPGHGGELYDLENDPREERNLYADTGARTTVSDLKETLLDWLITSDESEQIARRWRIP